MIDKKKKNFFIEFRTLGFNYKEIFALTIVEIQLKA